MNLKIQILTLLFSFLFGIFFFIGLAFHDKIIQKAKHRIQLLASFLYVLISTYIYFLLMKKINYAIFHPYEILMIIIGYVMGYFLLKWFYQK